MKTKLLSAVILLASVSVLLAQARQPKPPPPPPPPPPPISIAPTPAAPVEPYVYEQKSTPDRPYLVTPEQGQTVVSRFKDAYVKMGSPRFLIYVNRELVDQETGVKLSARSETTETVRGHVGPKTSAGTSGTAHATNATTAIVAGDLKKALSDPTAGSASVSGQTEKSTTKNTYRVTDRKPAQLADKQTVRDVERLFGRPLRMGGATLVDQRVATQLIGDKPLESFMASTEGEAARKDREALAKVADVVLEILISSRQVTVPAASGDRVYTVPDIHATAIRLKDAKIMGQASASELIGQSQSASKAARSFGVREISEGTALALMEDMTQWP